MHASARLRGAPAPTARQLREGENDRAVGGMRQPRASVGRVPRAAEFRDRVRPVLLQYLQDAPELVRYLEVLLEGSVQPSAEPPPGLAPEHLRQ
eukprot:11882607-Alexandrium_andersonii.AAC.1